MVEDFRRPNMNLGPAMGEAEFECSSSFLSSSSLLPRCGSVSSLLAPPRSSGERTTGAE